MPRDEWSVFFRFAASIDVPWSDRWYLSGLRIWLLLCHRFVFSLINTSFRELVRYFLLIRPSRISEFILWISLSILGVVRETMVFVLFHFVEMRLVIFSSFSSHSSGVRAFMSLVNVWSKITSGLVCNGMGEVMTDKTGIRIRAPWISSLVLYQLSYISGGLTVTT